MERMLFFHMNLRLISSSVAVFVCENDVLSCGALMKVPSQLFSLVSKIIKKHGDDDCGLVSL